MSSARAGGFHRSGCENGPVQRVFDCRDPAERAAPTQTAVMKLRRGRVAVLPDESMYLLAADAFNPTGVTRVRYLKNAEDTPLTVLIGAPATVDGIASRIPAYARDLMAAFWPGPLTLVLRQQPSLAWPLTSAAISVRMPLHPLTLAVVRELGPLAATSANRSGLPGARDCDEAFDQFDRDVDVYLDAGEVPFTHRSTIVDATGDRAAILRPGVIDGARLASVVPELSAVDDAPPR